MWRSSALKDFTQTNTCGLQDGCLCTRDSSQPTLGSDARAEESADRKGERGRL